MINWQKWGLIRIVRLVAGSLVVWNALADHQPIVGLIGGFLVLQAILDTGCGANGCGFTPSKKLKDEPASEIVYEEVR